MPQIIHLQPDPGIQAALDYVSRLQAERFRREQERAQEREAQEQRTIIAASLAAGAVGGAILAPAAVASAGAGSGFAAGTALTAAGVPASTALIGSVLTGASIGGRIGQQFAGGDIAGGVTTAAGAARGIIQSMDDQQFFGGSLTKQERAAVSVQAAKLGTTMAKLKIESGQTGVGVLELLQGLEFEQADHEQLRKMLIKENILLTPGEFDDFASEHPQGRPGAFRELQGEVSQFKAKAAGQKTYEQTRQRALAEIDTATQLASGERRPTLRDVAERDQRISDIHDSLSVGEMSVGQAGQALNDLIQAPLRTGIKPKQPTVQEMVNKHLAISQLPMPDGTMSSPMVVRLHPPTPKSPNGEVEFVRWVNDGGGTDIGFTESMNQLNLPQQLDLMNKAAMARTLEGDLSVTADEAAARLEQDFDALRRAKIAAGRRGGGQGAAQVQGTQQPDLPPGLPRAATIWRQLSQMALQAPVETWSAEDHVLALGAIQFIVSDLEQFGRGNPQAVAMMRQVLDLKEQIDAQRNR